MPVKLEVHEHSYTSGPRANRPGSKFSHSHEGGDVPHQHPATGPGCYTIDKDAWFRATGLCGGGRKKFTAKATGECLPIRELEDWQKSFVVVVGPPTPERMGAGPDVALPARMILSFGMTCEVKEKQ
jgi:hypothetical protein